PSAVPTMTRVFEPPPSTPITISLNSYGPLCRYRRRVGERRKNSNSNCERSSDQNVPRKGDVGQRSQQPGQAGKSRHHWFGEDDKAHCHDSDRHSRDRVTLHGAWPEHAEEESSQQRAIRERCD